jgi:beta-lactamase regulating signal transducer with metallopeptidase domain
MVVIRAEENITQTRIKASSPLVARDDHVAPSLSASTIIPVAVILSIVGVVVIGAGTAQSDSLLVANELLRRLSRACHMETCISQTQTETGDRDTV